MLVGGQNYEIVIGLGSFDAVVGEYEVFFSKNKERLIIKRKNGTIVVEIDGFFVKALTGTTVKNEGMEFVIESSDFVLTYEFLKFIRFKTDNAWIVVELKGGN